MGDTALEEEFTITDRVAGMGALIVDDVFRSGRTMSAVADATESVVNTQNLSLPWEHGTLVPGSRASGTGQLRDSRHPLASLT